MFDDRKLLNDQHSASLSLCWKLVKKNFDKNGYNLLHLSPSQITLIVVPLQESLHNAL